MVFLGSSFLFLITSSSSSVVDGVDSVALRACSLNVELRPGDTESGYPTEETDLTGAFVIALVIL